MCKYCEEPRRKYLNSTLYKKNEVWEYGQYSYAYLCRSAGSVENMWHMYTTVDCTQQFDELSFRVEFCPWCGRKLD